MGAAKHIGRVGGLAVALGVGAAVAGGHGLAFADPSESDAASGSTSSANSSASSGLRDGPSGSQPSTGSALSSNSESPQSSPPASAATDAGSGVVTSTGGAHSSSTATDSGTEDSADTPVVTSADPAPTDTIAAEPPSTAATSEPAPATVEPAVVHVQAASHGTDGAAAARAPGAAVHPRSLSESADPVVDDSAETKPVVADSLTMQAKTVSTAAVAAPSPATAAVTPVAELAPVTPISFVAGVVSGFLALVGLSPHASTDPAAPVAPPPLGELVWAVFRRIETLFFNQSPTAHPVQIGQSTTGVITGNLNARDADGDPLSYTMIQGPTKGFVEINPDGSYEYTPLAPITVTGGTDTFVVKVSDTGLHFHGLLGFLQPDWGHSTQTTVTVTVTPTRTNAPPVAGNPAYTLGEVDPRTGAVTVTFNVTDADGDSLGYQETSAPAKGGLPLDGIHGTTWTYVPTAAARIQAGASNATEGDKQDMFTISVSDGIAPPISITVKVPVTPPPAANTVIATIPTGQGVGATDVVLSPDGKRLYVLNGTSGGVSIIDTTTNTNIGVVPPLPSGPSPTAMAISADGTRLYVTSAGYNGGPDQVVVVDTAKLYYPETVANIAVGDYPADVAVSRDGKYLYVANGGDNTISVITLV